MDRVGSSSGRSDQSHHVTGGVVGVTPVDAAGDASGSSVHLGPVMQVIRHPDLAGDDDHQGIRTELIDAGGRPDIDTAIVEALRRVMVSDPWFPDG